MRKIKIITFLLFVTTLSSCSKVRVKNYFIPQNFSGNVAIIYSGDKPVSKGVYNYVIPQNGILRTEYSFEKGNFRINFYQKNDSNKYDTLFEELPGKKIDTSVNRIYFNRVLTFKKSNGDEVFVTTFYVGKAKATDLKEDRFLFERHLEKILFGN